MSGRNKRPPAPADLPDRRLAEVAVQQLIYQPLAEGVILERSFDHIVRYNGWRFIGFRPLAWIRRPDGDCRNAEADRRGHEADGDPGQDARTRQQKDHPEQQAGEIEPDVTGQYG